MKNENLKIGLLGGSFDPVHFGHLKLAEWAKNKLSLDRVILVPAAIPPHKQHLELTSPDHRLNMVRLAIQNMQNFEVSNVELIRKGVSYTIDTILFFKKSYNLEKQNLILLMGADNLVYFQDWKDPKKILENCTVAVYRRPGIEVASVSQKLKDQVILMETPLYPISSSEIRNRIQRNLDFSEFVPEEIVEYININRLYQ